MITPICRLSYVFVFEKNPYMTPPKYSVVALLPKSDTKGVEEVKAAINKAAEAGIANGKFTKEDTMRPMFGNPLHDGDAAKHADKGPEYKGHYFLNVKSDNQPDVVGPDARPLMKQKDIYSGCFGRLDVNFSAYNNKNKGVGVYLNNVMKTDDGPRLDGKQSGESAFAAYAGQTETSGDLE